MKRGVPSGRSALPLVQSLWIGERLTALERLSLASFVRHGHPVDLYTYEAVAGVPDGVRVRDAGAILPASAIFRYGPESGGGDGSVASFANLFRYTLLAARGGWWVDTDVVCLRPLDLTAAHCFGWQDDQRVNVAIMRTPPQSRLAVTLRDRAHALGTNLLWGTSGPNLMTAVVRELEMTSDALAPDAFYPIHHSEAASLFAADPDGRVARRLDGPYTVHFWNELARRNGVDKDADHPASSPFERLKRATAARRSWWTRLRRRRPSLAEY